MVGRCMRLILSIPSPASSTRVLRHHAPGSLSVCKVPQNFVLVKQSALRDCKLWTPTHCKLHCLNHTRHLSICLAWPRRRSCRGKKCSVSMLNLDVDLSARALSACELGGGRGDYSRGK